MFLKGLIREEESRTEKLSGRPPEQKSHLRGCSGSRQRSGTWILHTHQPLAKGYLQGKGTPGMSSCLHIWVHRTQLESPGADL